MKIPNNHFIKAAFYSSLFIGLTACGGDKSSSSEKVPAVNNSAAAPEVVAEEEPSQVVLRVMETTDLHANIMNYNY